MFETLVNAFKIKEIRHKIYFTILLLIVYRLGCYIPVPGIDAEALATQITGNDFLSIMNGITGGALANGTLFAMGIGPYINASIIMQLLTVGIPALERLSKQGEDGRKKIAQYTRYFTMALAIIQAVGILVGFGGSGLIDSSVFPNAQWLLYIFIVIIFCAGSALTMWLGERITENGVGNGISLLIFVGILASAGLAIVDALQNAFSGDQVAMWQLIGFLIAVIVIFG